MYVKSKIQLLNFICIHPHVKAKLMQLLCSSDNRWSQFVWNGVAYSGVRHTYEREVQFLSLHLPNRMHSCQQHIPDKTHSLSWAVYLLLFFGGRGATWGQVIFSHVVAGRHFCPNVQYNQTCRLVFFFLIFWNLNFYFWTGSGILLQVDALSHSQLWLLAPDHLI